MKILSDEEITIAAQYMPTSEEWAAKPSHMYWMARKVAEAQARQTREETLREVTPIIDKLFVALSNADFANGVEAYGMDEGRVGAFKFIKSLESQWDMLKGQMPES